MASGIPFGNTAARPAAVTGQPYFNGETARLELFTGTSWENIVQEVPGVASISGNYSEATDSGVITINGTNFVSGAYATAIGANGVQINAASTVYNSLVQLTATFTGLSNAQEPYDIKVTNPSNLFGLIPDALYINASPVWQTASGSLGTFNEQVSMSVSATATDSESTISYALASGSTLPSGITLNSSTGLISGTLPEISTDTTYTFTINASDGLNIIPRTFNLISSNVITIPSVEYLVVAGGGGGGNATGTNWGSGGGAGAGGYRTGTLSLTRGLQYSVSVGNGGVGAPKGSTSNNSTNGGDSTFSSIVSAGGGAGGSANFNGASGGSGGGGGYNQRSGGSGNNPTQSPSQGNNGGSDTITSGAGGGGGASTSGGNSSSGLSGNGGAGASSSITGTSITYAGGGGGGYYNGGTAGSGGSGGGGAGGTTSTSVSNPGSPGLANTGGGGGGGSSAGSLGQNEAGAGGAGGSGVVVIAYPNTNPALSNIPGTLTYDQPTRSGYRVYRFTAGTGTITI
jgi:hypothetical protein